MPDQNIRSTLFEAVIATGLIAVGVATGQPLVALASSVASVGGNWATSLAERGFHCYSNRLFTDDGVLNHDISKALGHAFEDAVRQVEYDWRQQRQYQFLKHQHPEQAQVTLNALRQFREEGYALLQEMPQLSQVAQQQHPKNVLSLMYKDEAKANEYLKPLLIKFLYENDYDDEFVRFVSVQLGRKWIVRFLEILKDPGDAGTRAWRACQMLWQKSLMDGIDSIQVTPTEKAETVHRLEAWDSQLKSLPPTERDPTGEEALETILYSVRTQLREIQETLEKTFAATMDIQTTTHHIHTSTQHIQTATEDILTTVDKFAKQQVVPQERNRKHLLDLVRSIWIKKLEQSIEDATFIPLGLYERPDLVEMPFQEVKHAERQLPAGTTLTQVYDKAAGELLILGEPGSGKSTLLLHLVRELLDRASDDKTLSIPVYFNLSTWAEKRQTLMEWLIEELQKKYQMPPKIGKPWIETNEVLPLLDGLDEVAEEYRATCVEAINAFRQTQVATPLVVGCRLAEYTALATKLNLQQAIYVQPMTLEQIHLYLGETDVQFQKLLRDEPAFRDLAQNPLMLRVLKTTYQGKKVYISENVSPEVRRQQIFTDYVESVFKYQRKETRYTPDQTKDWLTWLAKRMQQDGKTVFYLEELQLNWLANIRPGEIYTSLAFGILTFPIAVGLFGLEYSGYGLKFALVNGILAGLLGAIIAFVFVLLIETDFRVEHLLPTVKAKKPVLQAKEKSEKQTKLGAFLTPLFWERVGFALLSGLLMGLMVEFLVGPLYGMINGLFIAAFLIVLGKFEKTIHPAEKLFWTWESLRKNAVGSLLIGIGIGAFGGLIDAYPYFQQLNVFLATLYFWLSIGVALGIIIMLMRGYTKGEIDKSQKTIKPNQGIRNSFSNSLRVGLPTGVLLGLVVFFFYSYVMHNVFVVGYINDIPKNADVIYSIGDGVAVSYLFWLINGGFAGVQHFVLRFSLWRTKCIPWRYSHFLNYADQRTLLCKVGGGYIFMHKLLLEYFASLGTEKFLDERMQVSTPVATLSPFEESRDTGEDRDVPTESHILVPVLSATPHLLSCGHEQSNLQARFCSVCGRPISPGTLEQEKTVGRKHTIL